MKKKRRRRGRRGRGKRWKCVNGEDEKVILDGDVMVAMGMMIKIMKMAMMLVIVMMMRRRMTVMVMVMMWWWWWQINEFYKIRIRETKMCTIIHQSKFLIRHLIS